MVLVAVAIQTPRREDRLDISIEINRLGGRTQLRRAAEKNQEEDRDSSHAAHEAAKAVHWRSLIETRNTVVFGLMLPGFLPLRHLFTTFTLALQVERGIAGSQN